MKTDFNHNIALWQLFFAKWSGLATLLLGILLLVISLRLSVFSPVKFLCTYVAIVFIIYAFLELCMLRALVKKYGYAIGDTELSIYEGRMFWGSRYAAGWNKPAVPTFPMSVETIRVEYKNIEKVSIVQDIVGKITNHYIVTVDLKGARLTEELKIVEHTEGKIYGLSKTESKRVCDLLTSKIESST